MVRASIKDLHLNSKEPGHPRARAGPDTDDRVLPTQPPALTAPTGITCDYKDVRFRHLTPDLWIYLLFSAAFSPLLRTFLIFSNTQCKRRC